tara:strand:+ start:2768 stop:4339 length:1572 start_codon:yes stop_codon:yes gene_type:complete
MADYRGPNWLKVISEHTSLFKEHELETIKRAFDAYQGYRKGPVRGAPPMPSRASFNLLYAIVESAVSAMLPTNLEWSIAAEEGRPAYLPPEAEGDLRRIARENCWRDEAIISLTDSCLTGRSVIKVLSDEGDGVVAVTLRVPCVFFDLSARRAKDIGYFAELCLETAEEFKQKVGTGKPYKLPKEWQDWEQEVDQRASAYPDWISVDANKISTNKVLAVWEVWDNVRKTVTKWLYGCEQPIYEKKFKAESYLCPYVIFNLNTNATDMRGLSEAVLCLDNIDLINNMIGWTAEAVKKQVPITAYNAAQISENDVIRLAEADIGEFVGVTPSMTGTPLDSILMSLPPATLSPQVGEFISKLETIVQYVSALADAARGQITGARTATELVLIESQQKTRLTQRSTRFRQAWARVGAMALWHITGGKVPFKKFEAAVELTAYQGTEASRVVLREQLMTLLNYAQQRNSTSPDAPPFNMQEMDRMWVELWDLSEKLLNPVAPPKEEPVEQAPPLQPEIPEVPEAEVVQ